MKRHCNG